MSAVLGFPAPYLEHQHEHETPHRRRPPHPFLLRGGIRRAEGDGVEAAAARLGGGLELARRLGGDGGAALGNAGLDRRGARGNRGGFRRALAEVKRAERGGGLEAYGDKGRSVERGSASSVVFQVSSLKKNRGAEEKRSLEWKSRGRNAESRT